MYQPVQVRIIIIIQLL